MPMILLLWGELGKIMTPIIVHIVAKNISRIVTKIMSNMKRLFETLGKVTFEALPNIVIPIADRRFRVK